MIRSRRLYIAKFIGLVILTFAYLLDFLKVVRLVFWSGVVGPGTNFRSLALRARSLALRARTIALRAHSRATRSKARLVSKSTYLYNY